MKFLSLLFLLAASFVPMRVSAVWNQGRGEAGPLPSGSATWSLSLLVFVLETLLSLIGLLSLLTLLVAGVAVFFRTVQQKETRKLRAILLYSIVVGAVSLLGLLFLAFGPLGGPLFRLQLALDYS